MIFWSTFILTCALIAYVVWHFAYYRDVKHGCTGKLTYSQFKNLYAVAPEKWKLNDGYVSYCPKGTYYLYNRTYYYFSPVDTFRYLLEKRNQEKMEMDADNRAAMSKDAGLWQQDIVDYCKKHDIPIKGEFDATRTD